MAYGPFEGVDMIGKWIVVLRKMTLVFTVLMAVCFVINTVIITILAGKPDVTIATFVVIAYGRLVVFDATMSTLITMHSILVVMSLVGAACFSYYLRKTEAYIYPAAIEICNGADDNCDSQVDENYH